MPLRASSRAPRPPCRLRRLEAHGSRLVDDGRDPDVTGGAPQRAGLAAGCTTTDPEGLASSNPGIRRSVRTCGTFRAVGEPVQIHQPSQWTITCWKKVRDPRGGAPVRAAGEVLVQVAAVRQIARRLAEPCRLTSAR
jgi:hypothetical protein